MLGRVPDRRKAGAGPHGVAGRAPIGTADVTNRGARVFYRA